MISFIVPVYNMERYLRQCVDSILAQTYSDYEIILVDDGSTDASAAICREYADQNPRIRLIRQQNAGLSGARNTGIEAAKGDYLSFVDSDDMLHPLFAETLMGIIGDNNIAACMYLRDRDCIWPKRDSDKVLYLEPRRAIEIALYQHLMLNTACCKIYHRSVFDQLRFTPGILYEDLDLFYRAFEQAGKKIVVSMLQLYFYRDNSSSIVNSFSARRLDVLAVTNRIEGYYHDDKRMLRAARDRQFAAHFNMLALTRGKEEYALANSICWSFIKARRLGVLFNPKTRLKNRIGAAVSLAGKRFTEYITSYIYR